MAHNSFSQLSEHEVATSLEEAICNQQQLLQKLYNELDEEREASSSAASEALSMILRLQGEKAAMKLETSQYRRMAEERIYIVEEHLAAYEDLILHKEMEIASLEHQIESYRYKLISFNGADLDFNEERYPDHVNIRRLRSLPATWLRDSEKKFPREFERAAPIHKSGFVKMNDSLDFEMNSGTSASRDLKSRWELIRNILEEMKGISDANDVCKFESPSEPRLVKSLSTLSIGSCYETPRCQPTPEIDEFGNRMDRETFLTSPAGSLNNIHDVFEVPQSREELRTCEKAENDKCKVVGERQKKIRKLNMVLEDTFESDSENDKTECIKTMLLTSKPVDGTNLELGTDKETLLSKPGNAKSVDELIADKEMRISKPGNKIRAELIADKEMRISKPGNKIRAELFAAKEKILSKSGVENQSATIAGPTSSVSRCEAEIQQLSQRIMRLEGENITITRNEISGGQSAELHLLKEIQEQLNSIRSEMRSWKSKESSPADNRHLATLQEARIRDFRNITHQSCLII